MAVFRQNESVSGVNVRIGIVAEFSVTGGTRVYFEQLVALLERNNIDVRLLVPANALTDSMRDFFEKKNIPYTSYFAPQGLYGRFPFRFFWEVATVVPFLIKHRPSLLLCSIGSPVNWSSMLVLPVRQLQILHTCPQPVKWYYKAYFSLLKPFLGPKKKLAAVSIYASEQIKKIWGLVAISMHNGVPSKYVEGASSLEKKIVTLGHVREYKNPAVWLECARNVVKKIPDAHFYWFGEGELLEQFQNETVADLNIHFPGNIDAVSEELSSTQIYFHPSRLENHSLAILEAMSCGRPCVVSNAGGSVESIIDGECGFVSIPDDVQAFVDNICQLLGDEEKRIHMGENALVRYRKEFSVSSWERRLLSELQSIAS